MKESINIDFEASINEMHIRLDRINQAYFKKAGNEFDTALDILQDAIKLGDEYAKESTINYLKLISQTRVKANFGNPNMHIMQPLLAKIFNRIEKIMDIPIPPYGIVDSKKINAAFNRKKTDSDVMMLGFSSELFTYAQLICKLITSIIISDSQNGIELKSDYSDKITPKIIGRYAEITFNATAPLLNMGTVRALKYPHHLTNVSYQLCDIFETFVAAHEYAHVCLELMCESNEEIRQKAADKPRHVSEAFADYFGAITCIKALEDEGFSQEMIVTGIIIAMNSLSILDLYDDILFGKRASNDYLPFPNRVLALDYVKLNSTSRQIIQIINNLFIYLWNKSIDTLISLKKSYDQVDTVEDFINSNTYKKVINPINVEEESVDLPELLRTLLQKKPELFSEGIEQLLMRNITRFKIGKYSQAKKGFEECIASIDNLADNPEEFWYQRAIALCLLSMIYEKEKQQENALSLLCQIQDKIREPLKQAGLANVDPMVEEVAYNDLLTITLFELMVLANGDERKMNFVRYLL